MSTAFVWDGSDAAWDADVDPQNGHNGHWGQSGPPYFPGDTGADPADTISIPAGEDFAPPSTEPAGDSLTIGGFSCCLDFELTAKLVNTGGLYMEAGIWKGVSPGGTFSNNAKNQGTLSVDDATIFHDSSSNDSGGVVGDNTRFNDTSRNAGTTGKSAHFADNSVNAGTAGDGAVLTGPGAHTGSFSGNVYVNSADVDLRLATLPVGVYFLIVALPAEADARSGLSFAAKRKEGTYAARRTGVSVDELAVGLKKMAVTITGAAHGSAEGQTALAELGITIGDLANLAPDEQFRLLADRIAAIANPTERAAAAVKMFGRSGTDLLPMLAAGADGIAKWEARARELGLVRSTADVESAREFNRLLGDLGDVIKGSALAIGSALIPRLRDAVDWIIKSAVSVRDWIKEHEDLIATVFKVSASIVAAGAAFTALGFAVRLIASPITATVAVLGTLKAAVAGVGSALTLLAAHPAFAALGVAAAAVAVLTVSFHEQMEALGKQSDTASKAREAGDQRRATDLAQMDRLSELASRERLLSAEQQEAKAIIQTLTKTYGDFGVSLDETTGRITGLGAAQEKLNDAMRAQTITDVRAAIAELNKNEMLMAAKIAGQRLWMAEAPFVHLYYDVGLSEGGVPEMEEQLAKIRRERDALQGRLRLLQAGESSLTGEATAKPIAALAVRSEAERAYEKHFAEELFRLRLGEIDDEEARAVIAAEHKWNAEVEAAKKAGADLVKVEEARQLEIKDIHDRFRKHREDEEEKQVERRAKHEADMDYQIGRLKVENTKEGLDREMALLDLEQKRAEAQAMEAGTNLEEMTKIQEMFDLKKRLAETRGLGGTTTVGTFSSAALWGFGGGASPLQEVADNTRKLSPLMERMIEQEIETRKTLEAMLAFS